MADQGHGARRRSARGIEMDKILGELDGSGLRMTEFARQRGIPVSTLQWWRSVRRRRVQLSHEGRRRRVKRPSFVEVGVPSNSGVAEARKNGCAFEVVLGRGRMVRVPVDFDPAVLERLVRTLDATC